MKALIFTLITMLSTTLAADPVNLRIGLSSTGPINELQEFLARANQVASELQPDATTTAALITNTFHGPNVGGISLILTFEDLEAWANYQTMTNDPKWQEAMQSFPSNNASIIYQGLNDVVWQSPSFTPAQAGEVVLIYTLNIIQGGLDPLIAYLERSFSVARSLGGRGQGQVTSPIAAGDATSTNQVTVSIKYASAEAWAAATAQQNSSSEWAQVTASFPIQNYSFSYQALSTVVEIPQ